MYSDNSRTEDHESLQRLEQRDVCRPNIQDKEPMYFVQERCRIRPEIYLIAPTRPGGIFENSKLAKRFAYLREKRRKFYTATFATGDLKELRECRNLHRYYLCQLQDMLEPKGRKEVTRDIFSVMGVEKSMSVVSRLEAL